MNFLFWGVFAIILMFFLLVAVVVWIILIWNIPVTVLKYTGDKRRPMIIHRKARKRMVSGVPTLWVRGYPHPVRDFLSNNYYPSPKTKHGGLLLFEFEDGWLTPLKPLLTKKRLSPEEKTKLRELAKGLQSAHVVDFDYDEDMMSQLRLKIVDDVDSDFFVQEMARQNSQYQTGFDRLMAVLPWGVLTFVFLCILVGWIMWIKENPANAAAQCVSQIKPLIEQAAGSVVPPG